MLETSQSLDISHWTRSFTENQTNQSQVLPVMAWVVRLRSLPCRAPVITFLTFLISSFRKVYSELSSVFVGIRLRTALQDSIVTIIKSEAEDIVFFPYLNGEKLMNLKFVVILKVKSSLLHNGTGTDCQAVDPFPNPKHPKQSKKRSN